MRTLALSNARSLAATVLYSALASGLAGWPARAAAQVVLDGSLGGPAGPVPGAGGDYAVPAGAGRRAGGNLFHSFARLDLARGESATFTATPDVAHILARVTSGSASRIDGTLRTRLADAPGTPHPAAFYLVNPSGVVFGPGARLDVGGAFVVTTADVVRLADGGRFVAAGGLDPSDSVLTTAPPAAFGFLGRPPAPVELRDDAQLSTLVVDAGAGGPLHVVAGDVSIANGILLAPGARAAVVSLASPGEVALDAARSDSPVSLDPGEGGGGAAAPALGDVELSGRLGLIGASVEPGGRRGNVVIRAGRLRVDGARVLLEVPPEVEPVDPAAGAAGTADVGVDIDVAGDLEVLGGGFIASFTAGAGRAPDVRVRAGSASIGSDADPAGPAGDDAFTGLASQTQGAGDGGSVRVEARSLRVTGGGRVAVATFAGGAAGDVDLSASDSIELLGGGLVRSEAAGAGRGGAIRVRAPSVRLAGESRVAAVSSGDGPGGGVVVNAGRLDLAGAGQVIAQARAGGPGGDVVVAAGAVRLQGPGTLIEAGTTPGSSGAGGNLTLTADSLEVLDRASLSATTNGRGDGGLLDVTAAGAVLLDGFGRDEFTGIGANTQSPGGDAGRGGGVRVAAGGDLTILDGAGVAAKTFGQRDGGRVEVAVAGTLLIDGRGAALPTGINTEAADAAANGGEVSVSAGRLELVGGQITAAAVLDGGGVEVRVPSLVLLRGGEITAEAGRDGGSIDIDPRAVVLDRGRVTANAGRVGGDISIRAAVFLPSTDPQTAVTATGELMAGTVEIRAPDTDIAGSLARLPGALADPSARLADVCSVRFTGTGPDAAPASSFVVTGRGGTPIAPGAWLPSLPTGPATSHRGGGGGGRAGATRRDVSR